MTEKENERRANFIVKNAEQYGNDPLFKMMVDSTVYLTFTQKQESILLMDERYGVVAGRVGGRDE